MDGGGNAGIMHQGQQEIKIDILKKELSDKDWLILRDGHWTWFGVTKKTKNWHGCFEINSMFRTSVHRRFPNLSRAQDLARVIEGKTIKQKLQVRVIGGSRHQG